LAAPAGCGWDTINLVLTRKLHCLFCVRSSDASVPYSLFKPQAYAHTTTSSHTPPPSPAPTTARPNPQTHPLYSSSRPFPTSPLLSWYPHPQHVTDLLGRELAVRDQKAPIHGGRGGAGEDVCICEILDDHAWRQLRQYEKCTSSDERHRVDRTH
jgi:hypothetical protein